jgi:RNA polymerase subunit RPABC4/transcription elongation factor Spt4
MSSCGSTQETRDWRPSVSMSASNLVIVNSDTIIAKNINVELNGEFNYKVNDLKIGDKVEIPFSEFTNSSSERFDISKIKITKISMFGENHVGQSIFTYLEPN